MREQNKDKTGLPLLMRSVHLGNNLDELRASIRSNIIGVELGILDQADNSNEGYLAHTEVEDLQVSFIRYGAGVRVQCQQDDVYCFVIPYGGQCCIRHNKISLSNTQHIQLLPPVAELDMTYSGDCGHLVLRFKNTPFHNSVFGPLFSLKAHHKSREISQQLYRACTNFLTKSDFAQHHLKIDDNTRQLKQNVYDALLNELPPSREAKDVSLESINFVLRFIKDTPDWEYSVEDLSRLIQLSPRSFYSQFKKQTGTTPYRYYLNQKLCRARLDILRYGNLLSITDIAGNNGFSHLGRFASQYRRVFGELPTETLVRTKGRANL